MPSMLDEQPKLQTHLQSFGCRARFVTISESEHFVPSVPLPSPCPSRSLLSVPSGYRRVFCTSHFRSDKGLRLGSLRFLQCLIKSSTHHTPHSTLFSFCMAKVLG